MKNKTILIIIFLSILLILYLNFSRIENIFENVFDEEIESYFLDDIPEYSNDIFVYIDNNKPNFEDKDYNQETSFEIYSELDKLGRVGVAYANIGVDLMPTEERGSIGMIKPSGWHTIKYDIISGKYLYNRCHLIGYQLTGENANSKNLMTCTRKMNIEGMTKWENMVSKYIKETNNHVLYRVTPMFYHNNLLATGVQIEASSLEDRCGSICFNVFIYNVQDGIYINYLDGSSNLLEN